MQALFMHMWTWHTAAWHITTDRHGWAAWLRCPDVQAVFGWLRGHYVSAWEVR